LNQTLYRADQSLRRSAYEAKQNLLECCQIWTASLCHRGVLCVSVVISAIQTKQRTQGCHREPQRKKRGGFCRPPRQTIPTGGKGYSTCKV